MKCFQKLSDVMALHFQTQARHKNRLFSATSFWRLYGFLCPAFLLLFSFSQNPSGINTTRSSSRC